MKNNNGEGSGFYDEKTSRFMFKCTFVDPVTGVKIRKSFYSRKSLKEAKQKFTAYIKARNEEAIKKSDITLSDWMQQWMNKYNVGTIKKKTYDRYLMDINQYIAPYEIGSTGIKFITAEQLQEHFTMLLNKGGRDGNGIAPRSVNSVRRLILTALRVAAQVGLIAHSFDGMTKALFVPHSEMNALTEEQCNELIKIAEEDSPLSGCVINVALGTGMRIGEIFGLKWGAVDIVSNKIYVRRSLVSTNSGMVLQDTVKTKKSYRTIQIPNNVSIALRAYREYETARGIVKGNDDLVFTNGNGNCIDTANYTDRTFKRLLTKAGIDRKVRFHDLRHTFATLLLAKGVHIKVISEMLGHSSIRITLDTYSHVVPSLQAEAISALDAMFNNDDNDNKE